MQILFTKPVLRDLLLEENILLLGKLLDDRNLPNRRVKFNSINDKEIKDLTKKINAEEKRLSRKN